MTVKDDKSITKVYTVTKSASYENILIGFRDLLRSPRNVIANDAECLRHESSVVLEVGSGVVWKT